MANLFGLFDYAKPGKGVAKDEPEKPRLIQFFTLVGRKFGRLVQLNLLYLLFCLPLITIGPATAAMTYLLRQFANEVPVFLFSDFLDAFKANWKQALPYSIVAAFASVLLFFAIRFYSLQTSQWMIVPYALSILLAVLFVMANFYIYLMIVTLDLKLAPIVKNGFLLAILCLKSNAITLVALAALLFLMVGFFPFTILPVLLLYFSFSGFMIVFNAYPGLMKYAVARESGENPDPDGQVQKVFEDELA